MVMARPISKFPSNPEGSANGRTHLKQTVFVYEWSIENFGDFLERKYEIPSPVFCTNSKDGTKWKLVLFSRMKYPVGPCIVLNLVKMSDDIYPVGVKYAVSITSSKNANIKHEREKSFSHRLEFDECELVSNFVITRNGLLMDNTLTIRCEMDILFFETIPSESKEVFSFPEKHQSVSDYKKFSTQDLPNMNCSFDKSKIINKLGDSYNILDKECNEFDYSPKGESTLKEDSIEVLSNDFESLYMSQSFSDVTLICSGTPIATHKVVLAARSNYFKQLFVEKPNGSKVIISNVKSSVMGEILYYIYTGKVHRHLPVYFALHVYSASKKFNLSKLEGLLFDFLKSNITVANVTEMLQECENLSLLDLKYACLKFVNSNNSEVVGSEKWNSLIKNDPHIAGEVLLTIASFQKSNIL